MFHVSLVLSFHCWVIFHCMDLLYFISLFTSWWTFGCYVCFHTRLYMAMCFHFSWVAIYEWNYSIWHLFNFVRNYQTVFQSGCSNFTFPSVWDFWFLHILTNTWYVWCWVVFFLFFFFKGQYFIYLIFFKHLYWSIIALQWCVSFCFITKWISYTYTSIPIPLPSCVSHPPYPTPLGGHKAPSWSPCAMRLLPTSYLFYVW